MHLSDWLPTAKGLAVGQSKRIYHGRESKPNLIVQNTPTEYRAWCHRCNKGGSVRKDHVTLTGDTPVIKPGAALPTDTVNIGIEHYGFLLSKGVDISKVPSSISVKYSPSHRRIIISNGTADVGRAVAPVQAGKWLSYGNTKVFACWGQDALVLTEDTLSALKVHYVTGYTAIALLGTRVSSNVIRCLQGQEVPIFIMLDGDNAGDTASLSIHQRLTALGIKCKRVHTPWGYDPKDLDQSVIRELLTCDGY